MIGQEEKQEEEAIMGKKVPKEASLTSRGEKGKKRRG